MMVKMGRSFKSIKGACHKMGPQVSSRCWLLLNVSNKVNLRFKIFAYFFCNKNRSIMPKKGPILSKNINCKHNREDEPWLWCCWYWSWNWELFLRIFKTLFWELLLLLSWDQNLPHWEVWCWSQNEPLVTITIAADTALVLYPPTFVGNLKVKNNRDEASFFHPSIFMNIYI